MISSSAAVFACLALGTLPAQAQDAAPPARSAHEAPAAISAHAAQLARVPMTRDSGLVFVDLELAGERLVALLDTGANASAIDPAHAGDRPTLEVAEVVGTTGSLEVEMVLLDELRLGEWTLPALRATRRDLGGLLAPAGRRVGAILGSDAFLGRTLVLDFDAEAVEVWESSAPTAAQAPAARLTTPGTEDAPSRDERGDVSRLHLDQGIPAIDARLAGLDVVLRIDTGASLFESDDVYVNIPTRTWNALRGRDPGLTPTSHLLGTGADGGSVQLAVAPIADVRLGPVALERAYVIVQPEAGYFASPDAKGFVSNNLLARLGRVTLDYGAGELRLARRRVPEGPEDADR